MPSVLKCPHCGDDIPSVLFDAHVEGCDENPETSGGSLLVRHPESDDQSEDMFPEDMLPDSPSTLPKMDDLTGSDDLFAGMSFPEEQKFESEVDDEFMKLVGQLEITPGIVDVNVATLDDLELNSRFTQVKQELLERQEMVNPTTQTGRDLHSQRAAYLIELRKRGLSD